MSDTVFPQKIATHIAAQLSFLLTHCEGPTTLKKSLSAWAEAIAESRPDAAGYARVRQVVEMLVTIGHANAAFRLGPPPAGSRWQKPDLEIEDLGGLFLARRLIADILENAQINSDRKASLARCAMAKEEELHEQIRDRILRRVGA